jgi:ATP phosphoribosyltransferase
VFHEKDIPVQVAVGNYDLGICGLDWVEELLAKYPSSALVKVRDLGYGGASLYLVASQPGGISSLEELKARQQPLRIVSEYPNLAESCALNFRLRRFMVFPLWGAAEAYPPENADLALMAETSAEGFSLLGLTPLGTILDTSAFLIANRNSWEAKDMKEVLASLGSGIVVEGERPSLIVAGATSGLYTPEVKDGDPVWLALPDGHQQPPAMRFLNEAGLITGDYLQSGNRRPDIGLAGVRVKVIRPQDMPQQVANGNFDLAIGGQDWLRDHICRFPSSPVREILELGFGAVKVVAVVIQDLPADDVQGLRRLITAGQLRPLRVASEYVNIADRYVGDNHLGPYRVIPTWGASEAFLPNTQTGQTLANHNLKIVDTLFESSACLMGNANSMSLPAKRERINQIIEVLRRGVVGERGEPK